MTKNVKVKMKLQGHEKFALREGWLNKGIIMIRRDPTAFQGKNGPDIFGIGSNMVKSLRYWLKAFGLVEERGNNGTYLSEIGELILDNDPYFEDPFTLWILHSHIAQNIEEATSWYMFFNRAGIEDLDKDQIEAILLREVTKYANGMSFSEKSVRNDLDVLLNMYSKEKTITDPEEKNQSPFAQLNLVKNVGGRYSKNHPDSRTISEWVVLFELSHILEGKDFVSIEETIDGEKGLAKIYQLTTIAANELLDRIEALDFIRINRTAGLDVIYKNGELEAGKIVADYYKNRR